MVLEGSVRFAEFYSEILGLIGFKLEDTGGQTNKHANKVGTWTHFISFHFISF